MQVDKQNPSYRRRRKRDTVKYRANRDGRRFSTGSVIQLSLWTLSSASIFWAQGRDTTKKMRAAAATFAVVGVVVVLSLLALVGLLGEHEPSVPRNPAASGSETVVFVGSQSGFAGETLALLKSHFGGPTVSVTQLADLPAAAKGLDRSSIVVFNSDWLTGKVGAVALTDFFKTILPLQVKIVALGGPTSLLFDALKQARDGIFAEGRNPAYDNPPLAGYMLKQATSWDGTAYYGDSILVGFPESAQSAVDSISNWG